MSDYVSAGIPSTSASGLPREVWAADMQSQLKTELVAAQVCNMRYEDALMGAKKIRIALVPRTADSDLTTVPYDRSVATDRRGNEPELYDTGDNGEIDGSTTVGNIGIRSTSQDDRQYTYPQQGVNYYDFDVNQSHKASWRVEKWDNLQTNIEFMSKFVDEKAYDFARILDKWIFRSFAENVGKPLTTSGTDETKKRTLGRGGAITAGTGAISDANITSLNAIRMKTADELFDGIIPGIQQLENDNVRREQMFVVLPYEITTALWKDTRFQRDTDMSDSRNISGSHRFGTFEGISIYRSQHLPTVKLAAGERWGLMGYKEAFTVVVQDPMDFEIFPRLESYDAVGFRANMLWDGAMLRPDKTLRLKLSITS